MDVPGERTVIQNDDLFDALGAEQRRRLLVALLEDEPQRVRAVSGRTQELIDGNDHLVEAYLAGSRQIPGVDHDLLRQHHVHLPKLVEHCYVQWERDTELVTRGRRFEELRRALELLVDEEVVDVPSDEHDAVVADGGTN